MTQHLAALDPRIWHVVAAADRVACRHARDRSWVPDTNLVADFGRRVGELVGPGRVRRACDGRPELAALFDAESFDAVMARVVSGLWLGRCRPPATGGTRAASAAAIGP